MTERSAVGVSFEQLEQSVNVTENPQIGNFLTVEGEEGRSQPFNRLTSRLVTEKLAPMNARKAHTGERFGTLDNKVEYVAAVIGQGRVDEVNV